MMEYKNYLIEKGVCIKDAMKKIDPLEAKILFVVEDEKLIGALTDGDIRRYLMSGGSVEDELYLACNRNPKKVAGSLAEAKTMLGKGFVAIPIVDENNCLVHVYTGEKQSKEQNKKIDVPVVINAGGKGTRLDPFTKVLPKPLIPVGDLPIIEHIMRRYEEAGSKDFYIIVNYKKELIKSYFKEIDKEYSIHWSDEDMPLGTGGGLSLLKGQLDQTFFFICCDSLILADYADIVSFHKENHNDITMICAKKKITIPYGIVDTDESHLLVSMKEKPEFSFLTNTAMYLLEPEILDDMEEGKKIDFPDFVKKEKEKGRKVGVYTLDEDKWLDMGQMSELEKMRIRLYGE